MQHIVKQGETLYQISLDYRRPSNMILAANPGLNPNIIVPGQVIIIPNLPDKNTIPYSIHVFIAERELELRENNVVKATYPIAVGKMLSTTPVGDFVIVNRHPNPGGPFGTMWLSLSKQSYGIHGTNDPSSIGKAVSKGCIRMRNEQVNELASIVPNGTGVYIRPSRRMN
ncbi:MULTISPECIES: L,D-transpeptidase family protein [Bacillaceae]|uniref:L,D-transpeptidase family protein n=1 Tax=Bacillaceae TaxID=186817 RepID=UPI00104F72D7|nr:MULTISPECIES: L,D-transpeptidase family protein [Bacillaceae]MDT2047532.1 L,D-transpeptidase family protein [Priestia flexa]TDB55272.1 LysM peptidoglycan-binding domain-containing protein [Bacillus sp. CBEL-1]USY56348.1 L,D-transpeptidase family protein [Bacillus sp. 1780r2a1]